MISFERLERGFEKLAAGLALIGGLGLIFATIVTCISILLKLFGRTLETLLGAVPDALHWLRPILGEEELVTYGVGLALFAALPWVMIRRGHIKIDLFEPKFSTGFNRVLNVIGDVILAALAYLIFTRQWFLIFKPARRSQDSLGELVLQNNWAEIADRMRTSQESQILGVPLYPTYIIAEICVAVFFVVACFCVLRSVRELFLSKTSDS